jgi:hypothetical protein
VGYASSSQPVAHFGLGAAATAEEITVVWPDGRRKVFPNAAADRYLPAP